MKINIAEILKELKTSAFMRSCYIPMGYSAGFPIVHKLNSNVCITIPYLKYKITGEVDKTLVYPVKYAVTISLPKKNVVKYEDLSIHPSFKRVEFDKPVGFFRHDAIKEYNKARYESEKEKLFELYNAIIECELNSKPCNKDDENKFKELLGILVEPSIKVIYKVLDGEFYNKYMA
ncbi:MAG: hypothetical protein IJB70_05315 [Clostridia bacterium]|nr:hypothetical protein [Clostridia bacterium]